MNPASMPEQKAVVHCGEYIVPRQAHPGEELWCERTTDFPGWHLVWRKVDDDYEGCVE